ncbi:MAG: helix-turn-helix domain-containing protein [Actinomycetota bacterium]
MPREDCPLAAAAEALGDRWALLVIREVMYGVTRFDDMQADLGISRSVLSDRLRRLRELGVIERREYQAAGERRRSEYVMTAAGDELTTTLGALTRWRERHVLGRPAPARLVDAATGRDSDVSLTVDGDVVDRADATWRIVT